MPSQDSHFRPLYHFSPSANWMNDPNGMVYYQGEYHLFYQHQPGSSVWGPMYWGHAVTRDLVNWQHLPIALSPDEHGLIYSGSAVIDWHNTAGFGKEAMVAIFTYHTLTNHESQALAYSTDCGRTWIKYAGNPVLLPPAGQVNFRDPKVTWFGSRESGHWVMTLVAGDAVRFYKSPDLIHWQACGIFGEKYGARTSLWETPDLFELAVEGSPQKRWVLTAGIGNGGPGGLSGMQYFVGMFDGNTFVSENPPETVLWADFGADYYAAQSWSDEPNGRRLMIGWQCNWQYANLVPTTTWRGVCSLPREMTLRRTEVGVRLFQEAAKELRALRGEPLSISLSTSVKSADLNLIIGNERGVCLPSGTCFEFLAEFQVNPLVNSFGFRLCVGNDEKTIVGYDVQEQMVFVDRTQSGNVGFEAGFARVHTASLAPENNKISLHIFLDRTCVDVFANGGRVAIGDLIFPAETSQGVELFSNGGETILNQLEVYTMNAANFSMS